MRMLAVVVVVGVVALGSYVTAQDKPVDPKPVYTSEAMLRRISGSGPTTCLLRDKTDRFDKTERPRRDPSYVPVSTTVSIDGRSYRCVEIVDENFRPTGVAWTPVSPQP